MRTLIFLIVIASLASRSCMAQDIIILGDKQQLAICDSQSSVTILDGEERFYGIQEAYLTKSNLIYYTTNDNTLNLIDLSSRPPLRKIINLGEDYVVVFIFKILGSDAIAGYASKWLGRRQITCNFCKIDRNGTMTILKNARDLLYPRSGLKRGLIPDSETTFSTRILREKRNMRDALKDLKGEDDEWEIIGQSIQYKLYAHKRPRWQRDDASFKNSYVLFNRKTEDWQRLDIPQTGYSYVFDDVVVFAGFISVSNIEGWYSGLVFYTVKNGNQVAKVHLPFNYRAVEIHAADKDHILVSGDRDILRIDIHDPNNAVTKVVGRSPFPIGKLFESGSN